MQQSIMVAWILILSLARDRANYLGHYSLFRPVHKTRRTTAATSQDYFKAYICGMLIEVFPLARLGSEPSTHVNCHYLI